MTNIFNISSISESVSEEIFSNAPLHEESYMISTLGLLESMNTDYNNLTAEMYDSIHEASDKKAENGIMSSYFMELSQKVHGLNDNINQLVSRFVINVDNTADANMEDLSDPSFIPGAREFPFKKYEFKNINKVDYPKLDPMSTYKAEFDTIGKLLQELGATASHESKLKIIASVYNTLVKDMGGEWTKKCASSIVNIDDSGNFADVLYNTFRSPEATDTTITRNILYDIKTAMENRQGLINIAVDNANKLTTGFNNILSDVEELLFGTANKKIVIDTETDGIRNTSYSADDYTINQLSIFLKTKFDQIIAMCNVYYIALSIKLDAMNDYFDQCKEIIRCASINRRDMDCLGIKPEADISNASMEDKMKFLDGEDDDDKDDDDEIEEPDFDFDADGDKSDYSDDEVEPFESEYEESCKLQHDYRMTLYEIFELSTVYNQECTLESVRRKYVNEADEDNSGKKKGIIARLKDLIKKIKDMIDKFIDGAKLLISKKGGKIAYIKANEKIIKSNPFKESYNKNGDPVAPKINFKALDDKIVPKYNPSMIKDGTLSSRDNFISKELKWFNIPKGEKASISGFILNSVIDDKNGYKNTKEMDKVKVEYYDFITTEYSKLIDEMEKTKKDIEQASKDIEKAIGNGTDLDKPEPGETTTDSDKTETKNEAAYQKTIDMYFNEFGGDVKPESNSGSGSSGNGGGSSVESQATVYFAIASSVVTGRINAINTMFNKCFEALRWHIKVYGGKEMEQEGTGSSDNTNNNK